MRIRDSVSMQRALLSPQCCRSYLNLSRVRSQNCFHATFWNCPRSRQIRSFSQQPRCTQQAYTADQKRQLKRVESTKAAHASESVRPETFKRPGAARARGLPHTDNLLSEQTVSNKEQTKADWAIIKEMAQYLWPKVWSWALKIVISDLILERTTGELKLGLAQHWHYWSAQRCPFLLQISVYMCLKIDQVLNVQVPFYFKSIVDSMNVDFAAIAGTAWTVGGTMIFACMDTLLAAAENVLRGSLDGATRIGAAIFQELRNAVFASVAQKAIRRVSCNVFEHLLRLDLNFHLSRQTGGLTRAIDRGTKGISFLLTSMVFHILPTALEISMVCGILVYRSSLSSMASHVDPFDRRISTGQNSRQSLPQR